MRFPLLLFFVFYGNFISAQEINNILWESYRNNPAWIAYHPEINISKVETRYQIKGGDLRTPDEPTIRQNYGIKIFSIQQLENTYLQGHALYARHHHKNQQYNALLHTTPSLITFADTISGTLRGEIYDLYGGVAHRIFPHWIVGLSIGYIGGNQAKDTDPRNQNTLNGLTLTPGVAYQKNKVLLGVGFSYLRNRETINYQSFGNETKNGITFYPLWFYTNESFQDGTNATRSYLRDTYTASFQIQFKGKNWLAFCQPEYRLGNEKIWVNRSIHQIAGEIQKRTVHINSQIQYTSPLFYHIFQPIFILEQNTGYDIQQKKDNDHRIYETILRLKRFHVDNTTLLARYIIHPATTAPTIFPWQSAIQINYKQRRTSLHIYPENFIQTISQMTFSTEHERSFHLSRNILNCHFELFYAKGFGQQPNLKSLSENAKLRHNRQLMESEYTYLTVQTLGATIRLSHDYQFRTKLNLHLISTIQGRFRQAIDHHEMKGNNYIISINTGLLF